MRLLTICIATSIGVAYSQTVTVNPTGYITVATGGTIQFSATVTGTTNQHVTWSLPGNSGSSTTFGAIDINGLYTAPAAIPSGGVQVKATSLANSQWSGSQFIYVMPAGPTITSVAPTPLSVGSATVTINGSGFLQGALVKYSYNGTLIQTNATNITSNSVMAAIYVPNAQTMTFSVSNSGSMPSNTFTATISNGAPKYNLSVTNGSGGGSYSAGQVVGINANAPPAGMLFLNWTGSPVSNPNASSTTITMPASSAAVTANYYNPNTTYLLTVNNGSGGGTFAPGLVQTITANAPPAGMIFKNWTGAAVANANNASTTITMPAAITTVTANYQVAAQVPFPVSSHPRLWLTPADLPRLQSWAVPTNPVYGPMKTLLNQCVAYYNQKFFPGGVANANWPDPGDTNGYQGPLTEETAFVLAFNSLIDPSLSNRIAYAQDARNLIMHVMNIAALGPQANTPFRDPQFPTFNRANNTGPEWALIVDWIYNAQDGQGNPILTPSDKATIRNVFLLWAQECCVAYDSQGFSPFPANVINSLSLVSGGVKANRMASNNYFDGKMRIVTMMGLCIDPVDDPAIDSTQAPAAIGNTLRSYILDGIGAWLYQVYSMMGDPQTVVADYGLSGNGAGFGLSSGGLPPEGMLYGEAFGYILGDLLALQTAGFNNTALSGPQVKLIGAPVWDRYVVSYLSSLTPTAQVPPTEQYAGPIYQMASYGDLLRLWITPDNMRPIALLGLLDQEQGLSTHVNAARWFSLNAVQGTLAYNVSNPWTWGVADSVLYYMLVDPTASPASDPRPGYPLNFFDPAAGRVLARSDWTPQATWFDYRASWESIYHQDGDGGQFEFFRKGEWLTKEMSNYDNNAQGLTTRYHNTLALQNWCSLGTPTLYSFESTEWANGSQWFLGSNAGDPTTVNSYGPGYNYASSNLTNLYNRPSNYPVGNNVTDVTQATRSVVWLNNDYIVVYDRATTNHSGLFKTFNLCMANSPVVNGNVAAETMADGQQLFVQALLPQNLTMTHTYTAGNLSPHAELDPMFFTLTDQDPSMPADTRFLHVLQGADAGAQMIPASLSQNSSGTAFDGATFGSMAVFFPHMANASITTTTFNVPSATTCFVVTGLTPGASYSLVVQTTASGKTVMLSPGGSGSVADSAGLLKVGV